MNPSKPTNGTSPDFPAAPEPAIRRSNIAPVYFRGRPAHEWIALMSPRRRHPECDRPAAVLASAGAAPVASP